MLLGCSTGWHRKEDNDEVVAGGWSGSADHPPRHPPPHHHHNRSRRFGLLLRLAKQPCCCVRPAGSHSLDHHLLSLNHHGRIAEFGGAGKGGHFRVPNLRVLFVFSGLGFFFFFFFIAADRSNLVISDVFFAPKLLCNSPPPPPIYYKWWASQGSIGGNIRRTLTLWSRSCRRLILIRLNAMKEVEEEDHCCCCSGCCCAPADRVSPRKPDWRMAPTSASPLPSFSAGGRGAEKWRRGSAVSLHPQPREVELREEGERRGGGGGGERGGESGVKPLNTRLRTRADLKFIFWPLLSLHRGVLQQGSFTQCLFCFNFIISKKQFSQSLPQQADTLHHRDRSALGVCLVTSTVGSFALLLFLPFHDFCCPLTFQIDLDLLLPKWWKTRNQRSARVQLCLWHRCHFPRKEL